MTRTVFQITAVVAAVALGATLVVTVWATGGDGGGHGKSFLDHLHRQLHGLAQHIHGGGHGHGAGHHGGLARLVEELELTPGQLERLEKIHAIMNSYGDGDHASLVALHERLVAQLERGQVGTEEIRQMIDRHVEQIRGMGYAVTDELVALVNELDPRQREIVLAHIRAHHGAEGGHAGHGP